MVFDSLNWLVQNVQNADSYTVTREFLMTVISVMGIGIIFNRFPTLGRVASSQRVSKISCMTRLSLYQKTAAAASAPVDTGLLAG